MYNEYFGLYEDPFSTTPDPKFTFFSEQHREALGHLIYGATEGGGFVQLTGEVGTGKTTLCRNLLLLLPDELNTALIFNPRQTPLELVASLCGELHIEYPPECTSIKVLVDKLNAYLLKNHSAGRRTVVIIDEGQNLSFEALEQLRLLTNLETATQKLLQVILVGQPELQSLLDKPELRQLAQRITARYHLTSLNSAETQAYVRHRLDVAGYQRRLFTAGALRLLYKLTDGVPRLINVLCGRAMLAAYGKHKEIISRRLLRKVAKEVEGRIEYPGKSGWAWGLAVLLSVALGLTAWRTLEPENLSGMLQKLSNLKLSSLTTTAQPARSPLVGERASPPEMNTEQAVVSNADAGPEADVEESALMAGTQVATPGAETGVPHSTETAVTGVSISTPQPHTPDPTGATPPDGESVVRDIAGALGLDRLLDDINNAITSLFSTSQPFAPGQDSEPVAEGVESVPRPVSEPMAHAVDSAFGLTGLLDGISNAFTTLFSYWQSVYPLEAEGSACEKAQQLGLECLYGQGNWDSLHFYNRPAVIELLLDDGKRYHVVVAAMDTGRVTLDLGVQRVSVPKVALESLWNGSYIVLWRPPQLARDHLQQGNRGADVYWLSSMLERVDGQPAGQPDDPSIAHFDWQLTKRVIEFQRTVGLEADGIVGKRTLIKLMSAVGDPNTPALDRHRG